jgi:hypothetical protein
VGDAHCIVTKGKGGMILGHRGEKVADVPAEIDGIPVYSSCVVG